MAKSKNSKSKKPEATTATTYAGYITMDDLKNALLGDVASKIEENLLNDLLGEHPMGLVTDTTNLEHYASELRGKYPKLFKNVQLQHQYDSDTMKFIIQFFPDDKVDPTTLAKDYVMVADEVATTVLGVNLKVLRQLGITMELSNSKAGKYIHCTIDSTTRHILLNGMDDPYKTKYKVVVPAAAPYWIARPAHTVPVGTSISVTSTSSPTTHYYNISTPNTTTIKQIDGKWIISEG